MAITFNGDLGVPSFADSPRGVEMSQGIGKLIVYAFAAMVVAAAIWASFATLDVVSSGQGQVVASERPQTIQNLEGGVLDGLFVQAGDTVELGQPVAQLNTTRFGARLGEIEAELDSLAANRARIQELLNFVDTFQSDGEANHSGSDLNVEQRLLFHAQISELQDRVSVAQSQLDQRRQDVEELTSQEFMLGRESSLVLERIGVIEPLVDRGYIPRMRLLDLQQSLLGVETELATVGSQIPRAEAGVVEANERLAGIFSAFRSEQLRELADIERRAGVSQESLRAAEDDLDRTTLVSPVDGVVNIINLNTIGGTVAPGAVIMEITPSDDTVTVEARMSPNDVGFLRVGQEADVKLTAYDFATYGRLTGTVSNISSDSIEGDRGEQYFLVTVVVDQQNLEFNGNQLSIHPGMQASVDVLTGERTVLEYFLKPIIRATQESFRER